MTDQFQYHPNAATTTSYRAALEEFEKFRKKMCRDRISEKKIQKMPQLRGKK